MKHGRTDTSATAQHVYSCDKDMKISEAKTLAIERNWKRRTIRETLEIKVHNSPMNREEG